MSKNKKPRPVQYSEVDLTILRVHSKARTPTVQVAKLMKRSAGSLQQKCRRLGIPLGHRPYGKKVSKYFSTTDFVYGEGRNLFSGGGKLKAKGK